MNFVNSLNYFSFQHLRFRKHFSAGPKVCLVKLVGDSMHLNRCIYVFISFLSIAKNIFHIFLKCLRKNYEVEYISL